jgi:hypothetical protein
VLVTEHRPSGLVVARESMDEQAVGRALKRLDDRLVLQKHRRDDAADGWVWKVICCVSDTHAPVVFTWIDEHGRPLPLSHALVDAVPARTVGARNQPESADDYNARLVESRRRDADSLAKEVVAEHRPASNAAA